MLLKLNNKLTATNNMQHNTYNSLKSNRLHAKFELAQNRKELCIITTKQADYIEFKLHELKLPINFYLNQCKLNFKRYTVKKSNHTFSVLKCKVFVLMILFSAPRCKVRGEGKKFSAYPK